MDNPMIRHARLHSINHKVHWIQDVVNSPKFKKGAFTKKAKAAGYKTKELMKKVLDDPEDYDETTRRQAQFMRNIIKRE